MEKRNDIHELRKHLFETLDALKDKGKPMDLERAKAVCEVSQVIINSAKAEVAFLQAVGGKATAFLGAKNDTGGEGGGDLKPGIKGRTVHTLVG